MKLKYMTKDIKIFLKHIVESINIINKTLNNVSEEDYFRNIVLQDAVIRRMEVIGEAVKYLNKDFIEKHDNVEFSLIAKMRDKLIHQYFGVDLKLVWDTVKYDLPKLKKDIKKIIDDL
jgi:uncharacterized protein with HEPN domain